MNTQANLVQQKLAEFFSKFKEVSYKKKSIIYPAGEPATHIFYIKTGFVRYFFTSEEGQEFIVRVYKPTNLLAFISFYTGIPIEHTYAAITDVTGMRAPKEHFLAFLKENPDVVLELTKLYLAAFNSTIKRLEALLMSGARERILIVFNSLVEQIGQLEGTGITMPIGFTHQELAGFTGLTRETVTLELGGLEKEGIISFDKKIIVIKNIEKLRKEIGESNKSIRFSGSIWLGR